LTVVDSSIVIRLLQDRPADQALRIRWRRESLVHAPALLDAEVASVIRAFLITTKPELKISARRASEMLEDFADLTIQRHAMQPFHPRVLELRHNVTAYDAFYLSLAETLDTPLLADDRKFERAAGHSARVETWPS
jgi:predicted nucleic acid-binding protein